MLKQQKTGSLPYKCSALRNFRKSYEALVFIVLEFAALSVEDVMLCEPAVRVEWGVVVDYLYLLLHS